MRRRMSPRAETRGLILATIADEAYWTTMLVK